MTRYGSTARRIAGGVALAAIVVLPLATADAAPRQQASLIAPGDRSDGSSRREVTADRAPSATRWGIPTPPVNPYQEPYDGQGRPSAYSTKLKTAISFGTSTFLSYLRLCTQIIQLGSDDPTNCPDFHPPATTFDSFDNPGFPIWIYASGPVWVQSPRRAPLRYGTFPPVRVQTLAFGTLPVAATIEVSQPVGADGLVKPLQLDYLSSGNLAPAEGGKVIANRYWPGFTIPPNQGTDTYYSPGFRVAGKVAITLRDVTLDGRPVDVGSSCRTVPGSTLTLGSPIGAYDKTKPAASLRGRPGGAQPLNSDGAGSAQGQVTIAAFTGCGTQGEDLDPLLTRLISGSGNMLDVDFTKAFIACSNTGARTGPCPPYPGATTSAADARAAAAPGRARVTAREGLSPAVRTRLSRALASLPEARRKLVMAGLSPRTAAALRTAR